MTNGQFPEISLNNVLSGEQLPALPHSAIRLLELSQDPSNGPAEFAAPIESDPGLAGQVLRFVNSSYFGFSREISSIKLAITLVGTRTIRNFALWSAVFSLIPNPKCGPFDLKSLWQDSLRRALFARGMGKLLGMKEAEEPLTASLLQDMAVPLLAKQMPAAYEQLLGARQNGNVRLSTLERKTFGWTHAKAAGIMARQWNFPEGFAVLIENHLDVHRWVRKPDAEPGKLAVALSALLPAITDPVWTDRGDLEVCYEKVCPPGGPPIVELLGQIDREFTAFAPLLKLANPSRSLVDCYHEVAAAAT